MSHFGDCIRRHRTALGRSLQTIADEAKTSKAHVWSMEAGRSGNPSVATLVNLACSLEINPHELFAAAVLDQPGVRTDPMDNVVELRP